jgi:dephospho-CoA kinase
VSSSEANVKPAKRPVVIGLTGGVASGKSSAAAILAGLGAAVLDADAIARALLDEPEVRAKLLQRFGASIAAAGDPAGAIDRAALARRTFGHPEELAYLEGLVHPRVRDELARQLARLLAKQDLPAVVLDVPLLHEASPKGEASPLVEQCDLVVHVESPPAERRRRVVELRGWDGDEVARRETHQLPVDEKRRRADFVLLNDGTLARLRERVREWIETAGGFSGLPRRPRPPAALGEIHERDDRRGSAGRR